MKIIGYLLSAIALLCEYLGQGSSVDYNHALPSESCSALPADNGPRYSVLRVKATASVSWSFVSDTEYAVYEYIVTPKKTIVITNYWESKDNGIGLAKDFHEHLHTKEYYDWVNQLAGLWNSREEAIAGLARIAQELQVRATGH